MTFQARVQIWVVQCFGRAVAVNSIERRSRFLEEALELFQATGGTETDAVQLIRYVFNRPMGDPTQEAGGALLTLATLCTCFGIEMADAGELELIRVLTHMEKIREKQASKVGRGVGAGSPLP
jgi:hypothetical protein